MEMKEDAALDISRIKVGWGNGGWGNGGTVGAYDGYRELAVIEPDSGAILIAPGVRPALSAHALHLLLEVKDRLAGATLGPNGELELAE